MIIESIILAGAYAGIRFFESYQKKKNVGKKAPRKPIKNKRDKNKTNKDDHYLTMTTISMGLTAVRRFNPILSVLSTGTIIYNSFPVLTGAEKMLCEEKRIGNDLLVSASILMCLGMNYYFPLSVGAWFYFLGKKFISKARNHSEEMISQVFGEEARTAWIVKENVEIEVPLEALTVGDIVVVNSGMTIPVDGIITKGMAIIDQYLLTGESQPTEKETGDNVFASTVVVSGRICILVKKTGKETIASHIISILNDSDKFKSNVQLKGEKWADAVALPLIVMSGLTFPVLGSAGSIVILNSSIGNSVRVNAPLGTLNHITLASQHHILIKNGQALETLEKIDTILFDKTGTLTKESLEVSQIISFNGFGQNKILKYAATAERKLSHPIARAILKKADEANLKLPDINDSEYKIGYGIRLLFDEAIIMVGSLRFLQNEEIEIPKKIEDVIQDSYAEGVYNVMVAVNDQVVGTIRLVESVRPQVSEMMSGLRKRGIRNIYLVSGDHRTQTKKMAENLGMDGYFHELLPEEKAGIVSRFQKEGRTVCFVGDGINDAIAMQKADVSVSLRGASTIATDVAQIVLMDTDLSKICVLSDLSKKLNRNLKNTLLITLAPAIININGAFFAGIGIMSSYIIKMSFFMIGMGNAMMPLKNRIKSENNIRLLTEKKDENEEQSCLDNWRS